MTNLPEDASWEAGIYQIEQTDPVLGGPPNLAAGAGIANVQAEQLAKRTAWLKQELDSVLALQISTGLGLTGGGPIDGGLAISADLASQPEALEGTSPSKLMPALRVKQAIDAAIDDLVGAAPAQLDTLNELAAAITANGDTSAALTALIASKLDASAYTASDILAKLLGVDGVGSELDADMLDGKHASEFALLGSNNLPSAWVNFNGQGTLQVRGALNVSSVTDLGGGHYRINFATPMANTDYGLWCFAGLALAAGDERGHCYIKAKTANYLEIYTVNVHGTPSDWDDVSVLIMGGQ